MTIRAWLVFVSIALSAVAAQGQTHPPSGIIGWWAGDGDFRDHSGNGNNATPAGGGASPTFAAGKVGQNFYFKGSQLIYATIPDSAAMRPQSLTIEGWAKLTPSGTSGRMILAKPLGAGSFNSYVVYYFNGNITGAVCNNSGCTYVSTPFSLNVWHHIAFSYDDPGGAATKTARLYIDGVLVNSNATGGAIGYDTRPVLIGVDFEDGFFQFGWIGGLDEISLYNRALSLTEIQSINNAGINGKTKQAATNAGANSQTIAGDATITFDNVSAPGTTTDFTINPTIAGVLPTGFMQTGLAYDISTTAVYSGNIQVCFNVPGLASKTVNSLRIYHRENNSLVDRTSSRNAATNTICATVSSFSQFFIAAETVKQGQILYSRFGGDTSVDGTIWAIYPNGMNDHQITTGTTPRLSPDGNYIAFKRKRTAADYNTNNALWVMNLTTGEENEIFYQGNAMVALDFTPDSSKIIFDWACSINQINLDGTGYGNYLGGSCFYDAPAVRRSDGRVAFNGQNGILTASVTNPADVGPIPNTAANDYYPFWSPNGQFVSYAHYDGVSPHPYYMDNLYKIKPDGTGKLLLKSLTGTDRFGLSGFWSADGTKIYMPARIGGVTGIYEVATDGSGTTTFANSSELIATGANVEMVGGVNGLVPSAANVSISGRVLTPSGAGLRNAVVLMTDASGSVRTAVSSSFGYYRFDDITAGETVTISVRSKRFLFAARVVSVSDELTDVDFTAEDRELRSEETKRSKR